MWVDSVQTKGRIFCLFENRHICNAIKNTWLQYNCASQALRWACLTVSCFLTNPFHYCVFVWHVVKFRIPGMKFFPVVLAVRLLGPNLYLSEEKCSKSMQLIRTDHQFSLIYISIFLNCVCDFLPMTLTKGSHFAYWSGDFTKIIDSLIINNSSVMTTMIFGMV